MEEKNEKPEALLNPETKEFWKNPVVDEQGNTHEKDSSTENHVKNYALVDAVEHFKNQENAEPAGLKETPDAFLDPITMEDLDDPVINLKSGFTYNRTSIESWLEKDQTDPNTRVATTVADLVPNKALKQAFDEFKAQNVAVAQAVPQAQVEELAQPEAEAQVEEPAQPEAQAQVEEPAQPAVQAQVEKPVQPEVQAQVEEPAQPAVQAEVEKPVQPEIQAQVEKPVQPEVQAQAEEPVQPEVQAQVEKPAEPEVQAQVEKPAEPEVEAQPQPAVQPDLQPPTVPQALVNPDTGQVWVDPVVNKEGNTRERQSVADIPNRAAKEAIQEIQAGEKNPNAFICPITQETIDEPYINIKSGYTYEGSAIKEWLSKNKTDPMTRQPTTIRDIVPNTAIQKSIKEMNLGTNQENAPVAKAADQPLPKAQPQPQAQQQSQAGQKPEPRQQSQARQQSYYRPQAQYKQQSQSYEYKNKFLEQQTRGKPQERTQPQSKQQSQPYEYKNKFIEQQKQGKPQGRPQFESPTIGSNVNYGRPTKESGVSHGSIASGNRDSTMNYKERYNQQRPPKSYLEIALKLVEMALFYKLLESRPQRELCAKLLLYAAHKDMQAQFDKQSIREPRRGPGVF